MAEETQAGAYKPYMPGMPDVVDEGTYEDLKSHPFWDGMKAEADKRLDAWKETQSPEALKKAEKAAQKASVEANTPQEPDPEPEPEKS